MKISITGTQIDLGALVRTCEKIVGSGYNSDCCGCVLRDVCDEFDGDRGIEYIADFAIDGESANGC